MRKPRILVTGKNGQLGKELQKLSGSYPEFDFLFAGKEDLNLLNTADIREFIRSAEPDFFVNCAAYTAVDKAEQERELAYQSNAEAVGIIAAACSEIHCTLLQISTDYVFNGQSRIPYRPDAETDPINYYGQTKWMGEQLALKNCARTIVIRTSWVYSEFGNNFVKTMLRLLQERESINVVDDQSGSPTYAKDLAEAILQIIRKLGQGSEFQGGIYHFSNQGVLSWYAFALAIGREIHTSCKINPVPTSGYPTPARRPAYSVMETQKISDKFGVVPRPWLESLKECLSHLKH